MQCTLFLAQRHTSPYQADQGIILQGRAWACCDHTGTKENALFFQELFDSSNMGIQCVQVSELAVFVLWATDEEQKLANLAAHEWSLLDHQVLDKEKVTTVNSAAGNLCHQNIMCFRTERKDMGDVFLNLSALRYGKVTCKSKSQAEETLQSDTAASSAVPPWNCFSFVIHDIK